MSITFEQLLTDPKYREMSEDELFNIIESGDVHIGEYNEIKKLKEYDYTNTTAFALFNHLQKLKAESEKKAELKLDRKSLPDEIDMSKYIKQAPIQITDQKAREICAKYFNCPPNEIKIV